MWPQPLTVGYPHAGITPMLQLIRAILKVPEDPTQCFLLFANQVGLLFSLVALQSGCVGRTKNCGTQRQNRPSASLASAPGSSVRYRAHCYSKKEKELSNGPDSFSAPQGKKKRVKGSSAKHRNLGSSLLAISFLHV